ncbi:biotin--[acetyl-CoA-carboxylase] ligase [Neokomagataea anthophila]|uniref:Biotin--[acetyl-CoA-carboxylase] ligase n=1 Tax=Neokomagataea anthophila TaxID=2826925 RepID=A0ABS5E6E2_9PROT|nr:biotin--[acetyl-CoA-carboxylase] ligase [Neokomagataea anthophila]MBR0559477.1 biotin--[acetyl-CoA-carboxylase] ligase [Neokomagataea anthophila]
MSWTFEIHEELSSTSDLCKAYAEKKSLNNIAVQALRQTQGRGTRGRHWDDPGGNVAISFLLRPKNFSEFLTAVPFLTAVAVHDAISALCGTLLAPAALQLKWPNDVLLQQRKVSGILIETSGPQEGCDDAWVVIGVGVNVRSAPVIPGRVLAALSELGAVFDPCVLGRHIGACLEAQYAAWEQGGFALIRDAWLKLAHPVGHRLAVRRGENYIEGEFSGLDMMGRLLLTRSNGETIPVVTGEILLG